MNVEKENKICAMFIIYICLAIFDLGCFCTSIWILVANVNFNNLTLVYIIILFINLAPIFFDKLFFNDGEKKFLYKNKKRFWLIQSFPALIIMVGIILVMLGEFSQGMSKSNSPNNSHYQIWGTTCLIFAFVVTNINYAFNREFVYGKSKNNT